MGHFSLPCAETGNSIEIEKTATIHNPDKGKNLTGIYDGYGRIDGHDVYVILWMMNADTLSYEQRFISPDLSSFLSIYKRNFQILPYVDICNFAYKRHVQEARAIGLAIAMGSYYQDKDGNNYHCSMHSDPNKLGVKSTAFKGSYDTPQKASGKTPNQLIGDGDWVKKKIIPHIPFPLKITRPECELGYFHLPASEDCPNQGF